MLTWWRLLHNTAIRRQYLGVSEANCRREERLEEGAQKPPQPAQQEGEVVAGGGQHGVGTIAVAAFEVIAAHAVLGFEMADDRLDPRRGASSRGGSGGSPAAPGR